METDVTKYFVIEGTSIHEAVARLDANRSGIVLVVNDDQHLLGTVTDGDVRRAILADVSLDEPVRELLARKAGTSYAKPITAPVGTDRSALLKILREHSILHLPLVDLEQRVVALVKLDEFVTEEPLSLQAVIMAGGLGSRLRPLTEKLPKPMLPVGDRPLLEIIVRQLRDAGIKHVNVSLHHNSEKIAQHFGDGRDFGVDITYATEDRPLGTAGALGLIQPPRETTLVINGDILTQVDFRAMLTYHREHDAELTVAVHRRDLQVPYGVVECDGDMVKGLTEKPFLKFFINAGIYLLEPAIYRYIPNGEPYDMTDLIARLLEEGRPVAAFPVREYWIDIGQHADYEQAQQDMLGGKVLP
jgi:dTDP-glucose pyrophosphorylase/CBS domain-containing protein